MNYEEFLKGKEPKPQKVGFQIQSEDVNPYLFDWQREIVKWAVGLGRAALFEDTGLGKTIQQIEWSNHVVNETKGKVLIVCPLAVAQQTISEGKKINTPIDYVRSQEAAEQSMCDIVITNYDMLKEFNGQFFSGVVLDESSILKNYTGKTKKMIIEMFSGLRFKLACTATPAPNDHLELGNHAQFLEVMNSNEMISRWFINDSMRAGAYKLKGHARASFWKWVCSWAVCISKPSDIGFSDEGYVLPKLNIIYHKVDIPIERGKEVGKLFWDAPLSATGIWKEKAATAEDRCDAAAGIVGDSPEEWIIWCDTNQEADLLNSMIQDSIEVRGSDSIKNKEDKIFQFITGIKKRIVSKTEIMGFGLNLQFCRNMVFVGLSYSFEKLYQALRRSWRYGQTREVNAYMIYAESEGDIIGTIQEKQRKHSTMQREMIEAMKANGWNSEGITILKSVDRQESVNDYWTMINNDSVPEMENMGSNSIDLSVYSPPFANLYIYSDSMADMGNCVDADEFFEHYRFVIKEMHRITKPGRLSTVHCKDLPLYYNRDGSAGLWDFPGRIIREHEAVGWTYHSRVTIWKDPVIEMQRTKNHGLLYKNLRLRGEVCRQGMADYIVVFRKWEGVEGTESPVTVKHSHSEFPLDQWQKWASPVWMDIDQTNVLNYRRSRTENDEKHICPLQLDVIERCVRLWSNQGETVFSPFAGIGSEGFVSLQHGRKFIGIELKPEYYKQACVNLTNAVKQNVLF